MAVTKAEMKEAFGRKHGYQTEVIDEVTQESTPNPQTLNQFISEKQLQWAKSEAVRQIQREARQVSDQQVSADTDGVDLV